MFINHLKIAIRTLLKFKGFTSINLAGLSLGLMAGILIMIYVLDEFSYDQFHVNKDRVYRVTTLFGNAEGGDLSSNETNGWPIGKVLESEFPEVESVIYTRSASFLLVNHEGKRIRESSFFASADLFKLFSFPLVQGNPTKALAEPFSVVLSQRAVQKYFNGEDPMNKMLIMGDSLQFIVTGVMKDIPSNSHIQADLFVSFATYQKIETVFSFEDGWGNINMRNYVLLKKGVNHAAFANKAKNIYMDKAGEMLRNWGVSAYVGFEPLSRIYLHSESGNGMGPLGSIDRVYLLSGIALFVMLLACINFINLSTARSMYRSREVGLRKVVGSTRAGLIRQFMSESFLLTFFAFALALVIIVAVLPFFNQLIGKNYTSAVLASPFILIGMVVLVVLVSFMAGYYPAWVISALRPVEVLKGKMQTSSRGAQLRKALVVFQFVISVGLVLGTWVVLDQLAYMQKKELGFAKDQIFVINASRINAASSLDVFKNELNKNALIDVVSFTNSVPGVNGWQGQIAYPEGKSKEEAISVEYLAVDENYVRALGVEMLAGRNFDTQRSTDLNEGLLINEATARLSGWTNEEAIGKKITSPSGYPAGEIIGVVKDFHQLGLQHKIGPMVMDYNPESASLFAIRYKAADTQQLISELETSWKAIFAGHDFVYFFLDQNFNKQYQAEARLAQVFGLFAFTTILIASIGLLGLVSFMVAARTKEIGVRKILGANVLSVVSLLSKEFVWLILVANLITAPVAWYFASQWLGGFAYRMTIDPLVFVWTLLIALAITLVTVSYQTFKAANADPVHSLRHE